MIVYDPKKMLNKLAPQKKIDRLLTSGLSFKKAALSFLDDADFLNKKAVADVALKAIKNYKNRIKAAEGDEKKAIRSDIKSDPRLLIQRVQNEIIFQVSEEIKYKYSGEKYEWLPSDAEEPDPEHQLNYGKMFVVGEGEQPGDRIGCRCGMRILTNEDELKLG